MGLISIARFIIDHPLSRGRKLANLSRFVCWQIGARFARGPTVTEFANSARLLAVPGMAGATGNVYVGLHEFVDMSFVLHFLRPNDLFVDVGANIGSYTILASAAGGANCISFEPSPEAWEWLCKNINLNYVASLVEARQEAVGSTVGMLDLTTGKGPANHIVAANANPASTNSHSCKVRATTLDQALGFRHPIMLKIDVEGFETDVIYGASRTLEKPDLRCVLMELAGYGNRYGFDENVLRQRMIGFGFQPCRYEPFTRNLTPESTETDQKKQSDNTLFIRDIEYVRRRIETAAIFRIRNWRI
jgi:FkbM family methyltransferase